MKKIHFLIAMALPLTSSGQYVANGIVYVTATGSQNSSNTVSTAASTGVGEFLIGTGGAPTWAASLPFSLVVNLNTSAPPPGVPAGSSGLMAAEFTGIDGQSNLVFIDSFGAVSGFGFRHALGTNGSPEALTANNSIGQITWTGYNGTAYEQTATIAAEAMAQWSITDTDSRLNFITTAIGSTTATRQMSLFGSGGLSLGASIANTDPGAGNLAVVGSVMSASLFVSGNVGIGTTDQTQYPLAVNGTIEAKEIIVQSGWSDYVLGTSYLLEPLSDVSRRIKADGHLPGIPSAKEIAEHGAPVGEIQAKLLAKIEELTLHAIEQEKQLDEQKLRIERLESEISSTKRSQ